MICGALRKYVRGFLLEFILSSSLSFEYFFMDSVVLPHICALLQVAARDTRWSQRFGPGCHNLCGEDGVKEVRGALLLPAASNIMSHTDMHYRKPARYSATHPRVPHSPLQSPPSPTAADWLPIASAIGHPQCRGSLSCTWRWLQASPWPCGPRHPRQSAHWVPWPCRCASSSPYSSAPVRSAPVTHRTETRCPNSEA